MKKIVIALGGNALGDTAIEQQKLVEDTSKSIADLIESGNQVIIAHGNGPQVGMINLGLNFAYEKGVVKGLIKMMMLLKSQQNQLVHFIAKKMRINYQRKSNGLLWKMLEGDIEELLLVPNL